MVFVYVKLLNEDSQAPTKAHRSDAGYDLYASEDTVIVGRQRTTIKTGVSFDMPEGLAGLIWPRSGLSVKKGIDVLAGVVDSGYRGEVMVCLYNTSDEDVEVSRGDRIAQIIFQEVPLVSLIESEELETSQRGSNGFGSTGT
jgi:deoxyuridine 5'-triphosphate nucleotidohydrolase